MTKPGENQKRTIGHLKRLMREGDELMQERPLDEVAHAKWIDRAQKYLERKVPEVEIPPDWVFDGVKIPDLLSPDYKPSDPIDAKLNRAEGGIALMRQMMVFLACAIERLELGQEKNS